MYTWDWNRKSGEITFVQNGNEFTVNWYEGNGLMMAINEFKDDDGQEKYQTLWFFLDESHAKRCLGLAKGADGKHNMFEDEPITKITINRSNCRQWKKIMTLFSSAFENITIELTGKELK